MENATVARILAEMADICEIRGDNVFKIRALRTAAAAVESLPFDIAPLCAEPARLREIQGIGDGIARKVVEICATGESAEHADLLSQYPPGLLEMLKIEGVGPKKVRLFFDALGVKNVAELEEAARAGKLRDLPRMSAHVEEKLLKAIAEHKARTGRFLLWSAEPAVERLLAMARALPGVRRAEAAGSYRRRRETVGDIDILASCDDPGPLMDRFCRAGELIAHGDTKCSIRLASGLQADLRIVPEESFGAALHYFTGSKAHNVAIRTMAVRKGLTVNEYGVFAALADGSPGRRLSGAREEDVFAAVGLPWIPPEIREDRGEIQAAAEGRLPRLLELSDLQGDVHMHTTESDGTASIAEMAEAAAERGRRYIAITEHSKALAMTRGLDEERLRVHSAAIAAADRALAGRIRVFRGIEVDILKDGELDLAADALRELDVVVASVHSHFALSREEMTQRLVRAIESGVIDLIGHPTGRIILKRDPYPFDMEKVMRAAKARGVAFETSASPDRLDLSDVHLRMARDLGVKVVMNTDAHAPSHLDFLRYGVGNARRGWLEAADVLNTRGPDEFLKALHDGHR
jgi:DNA polymerase (family 10)